MRRVREFRPIEFHQACAIARVVLLREPTMTNFEWKEAVKDACVKQGYDEPQGDMLPRAMSAVERALLQTMGPRPVKELGPAPVTPKVAPPPLTPAEWAAFGATVRSVLARSANAVPDNVRLISLETLTISEHAALDRFYLEAAQDRLGALKRFAEVAIVREDGWNQAEVRATSRQHGLSAIECFVCRAKKRVLAWHHVIQIQLGGSNMLRNRVSLCEPCHADIHPWLPKVSRASRGWSDFAHTAADVARFMKNCRAKPGEVA